MTTPSSDDVVGHWIKAVHKKCGCHTTIQKDGTRTTELCQYHAGGP